MNGRSEFWQSMTLFAPLGMIVLAPVAGWLLGAFNDFQWVGQEVSPLQGFIILGTMCFPVAGWFFASVKRDEALAQMSAHWPTTPGVLTDRTFDKRLTMYGITYKVSVNYSYDVAGRKYWGERLAFAAERLDSGALLDALLTKYQPNTSVTVHYDPVQPEEAVLETSEAAARQRMWRVAVLLAVPGIVAVILFIRSGL